MEDKILKLITIGAVVAVLLGGGIYWYIVDASTPGQYDTLAQCITDSGAKFYGAFWCPHCQNNKKMFGKSAKLLPYIECSTLDGNDVLQICKDEDVESFPTWVFSDGARSVGEMTPKQLAEKTGCTLP